MGIFKIKLQPIRKEREYRVQYVSAGRKEKECCVCGKKIDKGRSATTFLKRISEGFRTQYNSFYTCGFKESECTQKKAKELNVEL
jgi:hypothetical protein